MTKRDALEVHKPIPALLKTVTIDRKKFIPALTKVVLAAIPATISLKTGVPLSGALGNVTPHMVDLIASLGFKTLPEELAGQLIFTAASKAAQELLQDSSLMIDTDEDIHAQIDELRTLLKKSDIKELANSLNNILTNGSLSIDRFFFKNPANGLPLDDIATLLSHWLQKMGLPQPQIQTIPARFELYYIYAVYEEWHSRSKDYSPLLKALDSPFDEAVDKAMNWERYRARLRREVQLPMMGESFGLNEVYIPLRAYYTSRACPDKDCEETERPNRPGLTGRKPSNIEHVVDLDSAISDWLAKDVNDDAIRLICGGPGSGKSSFAKKLASDLSGRDQNVVFIPLSRINPDDRLKNSVGEFLKESGLLSFNPMEDHGKPILLILDGLDELSMQGHAGTESAKRLVDEVVRTIDIANHDKIHCRCLITGRNLTIQAVQKIFYLADKTLHLLPYYVNKKQETHNYNDPNNLLDRDQRDDWWQKYGQATGKEFDNLPVRLKHDSLQEMTGQPLLNYLLAVIYCEDPQALADPKLPAIYARLLEGVYRRDYAKPHPSLGTLELEEFFFVLEIIAVAIWHGDGRTASLAELKAHCGDTKASKLLERLLGGIDQGLMRLLTAFYFRQALQPGSSETFEFTHKSFGEYLVARNIVATFAELNEDYQQHSKKLRSSWNYEATMKKWVTLCGTNPMDNYLFNFVEELIFEQSVTLTEQWQQFSSQLISLIQDQGIPMGPRNEGLSFKTQCQHARNAESALLGVHCACAMHTKTLSEIDWQSSTSLREWLSWLEPAAHSTLARVSLAYLNLEQQDLTATILSYANLRGVNLSGAELRRADLYQADLGEANLSGANLNGTELSDTSLQEANLCEAELSESDLSDADLRKANLRGAELFWANLSGANLRQADLTGACLNAANLSKADLTGANLTGADLSQADLSKANLTGVDLCQTRLVDATLSGTTLSGAQLGSTTVTSSSLLEANFNDKSLRDALTADVDIARIKNYYIGNPTYDQVSALETLSKETIKRQK